MHLSDSPGKGLWEKAANGGKLGRCLRPSTSIYIYTSTSSRLVKLTLMRVAVSQTL